MENAVSTARITINLNEAATRNLNVDLASDAIAEGPLVNVISKTKNGVTTYTVTILTYIPNETLNPVTISPDVLESVPLFSNKLYMNYYGRSEVRTTDKYGEPQTKSCRDFRIEYNAAEGATEYDLFYVQFDYTLAEGTEPVDVIYVRDQDDDPETDRGTVTEPSDGED